MARLIAEQGHCYGTRRLRAGDEYEASEQDARVLVAVLLARPAPDNPSTDELEQLRTEAEVLGIRVDRRWGPVRLNYEIKLVRS